LFDLFHQGIGFLSDELQSDVKGLKLNPSHCGSLWSQIVSKLFYAAANVIVNVERNKETHKPPRREYQRRQIHPVYPRGSEPIVSSEPLNDVISSEAARETRRVVEGPCVEYCVSVFTGLIAGSHRRE
jgi:hypothetical protein